jgi:hypothetical protein
VIEPDQYANAAASLTSDQLEKILIEIVRFGKLYPKWEGREERRDIICRELVRRGVNPHWILNER